MATKDYLPQTYALLLSWMNTFITYLNSNMARLGITAPMITDILAKASAYAEAYNKNEQGNAGKMDRLQRTESATSFKKTIRAFVNEHLRYNSAVTNEDRIGFGLNIPDVKPTQKLKPTTQIEATVDSSVIRQVTLHYKNKDSKSNAKPENIHGAEIRWNIQETPPTSDEELIHSEFSTRTPHTLTFDANRRGKTIYFLLRWENTRGEKGPLSELYSAVIP
jgi:hypothetical protein